MTTGSKTGERGPPRQTRRPVRGLLDALSSLTFALSVVVLIVVVSVIGTVLPQGADVQKYLQAHPDAEARMELLDFLGLTHVYTSWWFVLLLCLFASCLTACTLRRYAASRRMVGRPRRRALGSVLTHISLVLILAGGVVRVLWGSRGHLEFREGETRKDYRVADEHVPLPFAVHLAKFETEFYEQAKESTDEIQSERLLVVWPAKDVRSTVPVAVDKEQWIVPEGEARGSAGALRLNIRRRVPDFVIDTKTREVNTRSETPRNPAILVETVQAERTNTLWLFAKYPDFNMHTEKDQADEPQLFKLVYQVKARAPEPKRVKDYRSTLRILEGDTVVREKTIEVNAPLTYKGYTFYQSGYSPKDPKWTSLQVVRDPGVPLVYAGFILVIVGLTMVFYVYPGQGAAGPSRSAQESPRDDDTV